MTTGAVFRDVCFDSVGDAGTQMCATQWPQVITDASGNSLVQNCTSYDPSGGVLNLSAVSSASSAPVTSTAMVGFASCDPDMPYVQLTDIFTDGMVALCTVVVARAIFAQFLENH